MREAMVANAGGLPPVGSAEAFFHYLQGNLLADRGDHAAAIEAYRQVLTLDELGTHARVRLANEYWRLGLTEKAETEAKLAVQQDPRSAEAHETLGNFYLQEESAQAAARELERAVQLDPQRPEGHRALVQARFALADERGLERALDAWAKASAHSASNDALGWREYGELLLSRGDFARAEKFLSRGLQYRPEDPEALAALGRLADQRGEPERAMAFYVRSLRADPEAPAVLFALGQHHLRRAALDGVPQPEIAAARGCFNSLVAIAADEAPAQAEVALAYLQAHLESEALSELDQAVLTEPENGRWRYYRGLVELQLRRYVEASEDLGSVAATDDNYPDARAKLGLSLYKLGQVEAAVSALRTGLSMRPGSPQLAVVLAEIERAQGQGAEAVTLLERTADGREFTPELVEALADAYEGVGRLHDAIALLQETLKAQPAAAHLRFLLGAKLQRGGDFEAAIATMRELLRADPRNAEALNFIGYEYAERGIRLPEAEKLVAQALSIEPENGLIADSLGWVYFKEGKLRAALDALLRAGRFSPDEPVIAEHLGDVYQASGEVALALQSYGRALSILDDSPDAEVASSVRQKLERLKARTASTE